MSYHVQNILLVTSLYDSFILAEDGNLGELILSEFLDLNLRHTPELTRVSTGSEALTAVGGTPRPDLVICSLQVGDMTAVELAHRLRETGFDVPVVVLAYDARELTDFLAKHDASGIERIFLWQGDVRILLAIVKYIEDRRNLAADTGRAGVPAIVVVEDNVRYYSSFLPVMYGELMLHGQKLMPEGLNLAHKLMRIRARPKILLCQTFEEAWEFIKGYPDEIMGVISDIEFPHNGVDDPHAGVELAREVRALRNDIPVMLQSSRPENEELARQVGAAFALKDSPLLLQELRNFILYEFGFGDFTFRLPDGTEVDRARDLHELGEKLRTVPTESIVYHAVNNHFSRWLKTRTEFPLAERLRPRKATDFSSSEALRAHLISELDHYRTEQNRGIVVDFDRDRYDGYVPFTRVGSGSLGGKARGLAFVNYLLREFSASTRFPRVRIRVPPTLVLGTEVFDDFLDRNRLRDFAIECDDDEELLQRFVAGGFAEGARRDLASFMRYHRCPLAVRSSSLLEDSQFQPFAGIYETYMLPNNDAGHEARLANLVNSVKRVYASTFSSHAKAYVEATPYRLEEEKMAVIVQEMIGAQHGGVFYPDFSGVARSHNFYPTPPFRSEDGVAAVALGLGRTVTNGERCVRFCPHYPAHVLQFSSVKDYLDYSQRQFWALDLGFDAEEDAGRDQGGMVHLTLERAEEHGTLQWLGSTYSAENDAVYDGLSRDGVRLVSFAPILKQGAFPLADILAYLLDIGEQGTAGPVEIEFAVNLATPSTMPRDFGFLQMRPLALSREFEELRIAEVAREDVVVESPAVLGHGRLESIRDIVAVNYDRFDRSMTRDTAREVAVLNAELKGQGRPYVLVGVGRWGSTDPWLGIPVTWDQIAGARVIVEAGFKDLRVTPSQGTHFFQNLTSSNVGYFTVNQNLGEGFVDWDWLGHHPAAQELQTVRHLRLEHPLHIVMNGKTNRGVILKPGTNRE